MNQIQFKTYFNERAKFTTWLFAPFYLLIIGHAIAPISYGLLYPLIWGVFFYNAFFDLICFRYDQKVKDYQYLRAPEFFLIALSFGFGLLYFSSLLFAFDFSILILNAVIVILSICLSLVFKEHKFIIYLRKLIVPLFLGMVSFTSGNEAYIWPLFISFYFIFYEKLEEFIGERFVLINGALLVSTFLFKLAITLYGASRLGV